MHKNICGAVGLSALLLLGSAPTALWAHEGHEYEGQQGEYRGEREETGRYEPQDEDDRWESEYNEEDEDDTYRSSSRRYPPPDDEYSSPRERRSRVR